MSPFQFVILLFLLSLSSFQPTIQFQNGLRICGSFVCGMGVRCALYDHFDIVSVILCGILCIFSAMSRRPIVCEASDDIGRRISMKAKLVQFIELHSHVYR